MNLPTTIKIMLAACAAAALPCPALAGMEAFRAGEVIPEFGKIATVEGAAPIPADARFKVSFDITKQAEAGQINRSIASAARFINMHGEAGVDPENISLALVLHGGATRDVVKQERYAEVVEGDAANANAALIEALVAKGVKFYVCGQSAAYYGIKAADLLPGVEMSLSAMTAHALLQQDGYTLNPF